MHRASYRFMPPCGITETLSDVESVSVVHMGRVLSDGFSGNFLKEALRAADEKMPYRGPEIYQAGEYTYRCKVTGDFTWFQGCEEIYQGDQKVYECVFHGGLLK